MPVIRSDWRSRGSKRHARKSSMINGSVVKATVMPCKCRSGKSVTAAKCQKLKTRPNKRRKKTMKKLIRLSTMSR